ncbi:MAG: SDR family oxidoreductase [Acidimicrobiales bacterium]|nr:SDR family oxidoreductase [Acidimicrobiales bacterium]
MGALEGRKLLVIGASSGTGRATAIAFARHGAQVAFAARRADRLAEAIAEAGSGHAVAIDVLDPASIDSGVAAAADALGGLDGILYTAGMSPVAELRETDAADWERVFAVNTFGPNLVIRAALPHLSTDAVVGVVSSDSSGEPRHSLVPYASSKIALEATLQGWRTEELGGKRFLTIVLGPTLPTEFGDAFPPDRLGELFGHWQRQGFRTGLMNADDVAEQLAVTYTTMFSFPTFGVEELLLRAPEPAQALDNFGSETVE